ncbi:F-box/LRR-repeat protein [Trifolium pratense]|uniref:F-box/LRR-repeat protein n=1 Tax=Trifolium pratense TaxID=57577 RepID=A0A2K3MRF0_TRIPR|nr:F-box/LRR-repeat protein [Trifolium pratense]
MEKRHTTRRSKRRIRSVDTDFDFYVPTFISSSQQIASSIQTGSKKRKLVTEFNFYLPDECWESIFKFIIRDDHNYNYLDSISIVSKRFLSITDRFRFSLTFYNSSSTRLFQRFTNLISLNLSGFVSDHLEEINALLEEISHFPLKLTSLNISHKPIPVDGLRTFSQNITSLTSLTCSYSKSFNGTVMVLIADCFPLLEELDLSNPKIESEEKYESLLNGVKALSSKLYKIRKVNLSRHKYINDQSLFHLFKNWKLLEEAIILNCDHITNAGVASALRERPTLRSLSFDRYTELPDNATFFALFSDGPSLSEISLRHAYWVENSNPFMDVAIIPQLKSLCLEYNHTLRDERIKIFVSVFPNLQLLNLSYCSNISEEGICQVLKICRKIIHLNLTGCSQLKLLELNFEVPKLEVLNLSRTKVDDKTLYVISKHCRGVLQLLLKCCNNVTEKGVKHVIENCTQLREINLSYRNNVDANVVASMVISRPSWRDITPSSLKLSSRKKIFLRQECPFASCLRILW